MKRFLMILAALCLFTLGVYYLQTAADYRQTTTATSTTQSSIDVPEAKLTMTTKIVSKDYQLAKENDDFDQDHIYQGEFPFEKLDPSKTYELTITLVNGEGQRLVSKKGNPLVSTAEIKVTQSEGKIIFDLSANQTLREQIQELDGFQAKGVLKEKTSNNDK